MNRYAINITICVISLVFTASLMAEDMYKWTDKSGNVHYSRHKPAGVDAEKISPPPPPPSEAADSNKPFVEQIEGSLKKSKDAEQEAEQAALDAGNDAASQKNCEIARKNLQGLQDTRVPRYKDETGEIVRMDEETRQLNIQKAQESIKRFCNQAK